MPPIRPFLLTSSARLPQITLFTMFLFPLSYKKERHDFLSHVDRPPYNIPPQKPCFLREPRKTTFSFLFRRKADKRRGGYQCTRNRTRPSSIFQDSSSSSSSSTRHSPGAPSVPFVDFHHDHRHDHHASLPFRDRRRRPHGPPSSRPPRPPSSHRPRRQIRQWWLWQDAATGRSGCGSCWPGS